VSHKHVIKLIGFIRLKDGDLT